MSKQWNPHGTPAGQPSIRSRVLAGEQVTGAMVFEFQVPGMPAILSNAGCEYVIYDMEHASASYETLKWNVAACRGLPVRPMVRVPTTGYTWLARALDAGAEGVMVPMVESAEEARSIVEACRYPPDGRRGAAFGFAHDHYMAGPVTDKVAFANQRNLVIAQIESERGIEAVDAIAATEGVDVLWVGHFDLSNFMGIPGQFDSPEFDAAVNKVVAAARKHNKALGFMASDAKWVAWAKQKGFNMLAAGTDNSLFAAAMTSMVDLINQEEK
ncbi:MAG: aldolase/citrate lyase family protein [Burkholderiaceae bacterium]